MTKETCPFLETHHTTGEDPITKIACRNRRIIPQCKGRSDGGRTRIRSTLHEQQQALAQSIHLCP